MYLFIWGGLSLLVSQSEVHVHVYMRWSVGTCQPVSRTCTCLHEVVCQYLSVSHSYKYTCLHEVVCQYLLVSQSVVHVPVFMRWFVSTCQSVSRRCTCLYEVVCRYSPVEVGRAARVSSACFSPALYCCLASECCSRLNNWQLLCLNNYMFHVIVIYM